MKLYTYWRSSAAYRVRIGLNLKGLTAEPIAVNLRQGDQRESAYRDLNPQGLVPALVDGDRVVGQSLAILEYLDELHPEPALLPPGPGERARVRQLALSLACDVHPLQNLRVLEYVRTELGASEEGMREWVHHWVGAGLAACEALVAGHPETGRFSHSDEPSLADIVLVPQLYNARRWELPLEPYPTLVAIDAACRELEAFKRAAPEEQPRD